MPVEHPDFLVQLFPPPAESPVGLAGRGFNIELVKMPVTVTFDPERPGESLKEETAKALVEMVEGEEPS